MVKRCVQTQCIPDTSGAVNMVTVSRIALVRALNTYTFVAERIDERLSVLFLDRLRDCRQRGQVFLRGFFNAPLAPSHPHTLFPA
jgi:hypothetical protein